ncbi:hypothetical protein Ahy_A07g033523 [Arachis hypogaea]|uniref:Replication factor A C-terminal domain-containing protein n=1 Tax=Arachis hypogaea TaxID=3818 RepID=A0A445C9E2_ARAHY|nr:hypothetical protein Ahy_A07g033523 [Arachis hypogaea]
MCSSVIPPSVVPFTDSLTQPLFFTDLVEQVIITWNPRTFAFFLSSALPSAVYELCFLGVCFSAVHPETIEDIITDLISPNRCYSDAENGGFFFILGTISFVLKNHKWWFSTCLCGSLVSANKNILSCDLCQLQCIDAVPRFCLKIVVSHTNGNNIFVLKDREVVQIIKTRCSSFLDNHPELNQESYCKVVPLKLISSLLHKKVVFMVDAMPVDYEMNRSVHIVQQIWDDVSVINVFEAAAEMNEHKIHVLVDSIPEVEDAFSQCGSDHEAVEDLHAF